MTTRDDAPFASIAANERWREGERRIAAKDAKIAELEGWLRENKAEAMKAWTEVHRLRERVASLEVYAITCDRSLRAAGLSAASEVPEIAPASDEEEASGQ